jgi:hypothetical protein
VTVDWYVEHALKLNAARRAKVRLIRATQNRWFAQPMRSSEGSYARAKEARLSLERNGLLTFC